MPFHRSPETIPSNFVRQAAQTTPMNRPFRVALVYKNFRKSGSGHIGLGVTALNTAKFLRAKGIYVDVWGVTDISGLLAKLKESETIPANIQPVTHVVISAPWLPSADLQDIAITNSHIGFASVCHSNVPFLAADPNAFRLSREYGDVERSTPNFHLGCNSASFAGWFANSYGMHCWTIPNFYMLDGSANPHRPVFSGGTLRIGCFGATRILKNILSAGAAAIEIASGLRVNLEFWISTGRDEGGQGTVQSLRQMFQGLYWAKLKEQAWGEWSCFRTTARHMHLGMQPSFTESFNNVTADLIAEGVASMVSYAVEWAPDDWKANSDDISDMARVGRRLLLDPNAPVDGLNALANYNASAYTSWIKFLTDTTAHM